MDSISIVNALRELQKIAKPAKKLAAGAPAPVMSAAETALRARVPTAILVHFDRSLRAGRTGIAPVRNGICGGCHIRIPRAQSAGIRGSHELDLCDQCGAFLFSEEKLVENAAAKTPALV